MEGDAVWRSATFTWGMIKRNHLMLWIIEVVVKSETTFQNTHGTMI